MRVKCNVYSAMVLSVLLQGAVESWALSGTQLSRLETLHNSWLRCFFMRYYDLFLNALNDVDDDD